MMVVEEEFDVVFTQAAPSRRSFATINTLAAVIANFQRPDDAASTPERTLLPVSDLPVAR